MDLNNKKLYLAGLTIIFAGLVFGISASPAWAGNCEKSQNKFSFASFLNPLASLAEKVVKDFGYKISLAAAPDPDTCGSDSVGCSGSSATANISWTPYPSGNVAFYVLFASNMWPITVYGTSYTLAGLANNTIYGWAVDAVISHSGVHVCGYPITTGVPPPGAMICPYGSFTTPNCVPPPPTVTLTTWPVFTIPESVSLYWSSTNADSCNASGDWSGAKPTQGEERFSKPSGNYSFTLTCTGPGGSAYDTENVRVIQVPQCSFTANPTTIILPASSTLSWSCQYANSCSIDQGIGSVNPVSGTKSVRPSQTTTYTLNCSGLDGSRSSQATVNIGFEPTRREVPPY